ncbi:MAG: TolC family protein [Magnetococcales bacterium]|nr:TolC family protein [Magnetococcales bacterium]
MISHRIVFFLAVFCIPATSDAVILDFMESITDAVANFSGTKNTEKFNSSPSSMITNREEKGPVLNLDDCLALALRDNLNLKSQGQQVISSEAMASASMRDLLPGVSVSSQRSDIINAPAGSSLAETYSTTLSVTQPIYHGGALLNTWKKSEIARDQAIMDAERQVQTLTKNVKDSWIDLLKAIRQTKEAEESLERLKEHARFAKAFFDEGKYWANDVLQAQVKIAQGEQALIEAENSVALAKSTLNVLMHRPLIAPFEAAGDLEFKSFAGNLDIFFNKALKNRKDLEKARLNVASSRLSEQTKKGSMFPQLDLTGSTAWNAQDISYNHSHPTTTVLMTATWDVWKWGKTMKEQQSLEAATEKSSLDAQALEEAVLSEVRKAYLEVKGAERKVGVLAQSIDQAKENFRVNQIRYQEKLSTANDVLTAMDLLTTTKNSHTDALSSYLKALGALELAVGIDMGELEHEKNNE